MAEDIMCKSIFKNGKAETSSQVFNEIWAKLINQTERSKAALAGVH